MRAMSTLPRIAFGGLTFVGTGVVALAVLWVWYYGGLRFRSAAWSIGLGGQSRVDGPFLVLALLATCVACIGLLVYLRATRPAYPLLVGGMTRSPELEAGGYWPY